MANKRYGFFGPQPTLGDAPQGTLAQEPEEVNYRTRVYGGMKAFSTAAMKRGSGPDIGLSAYIPSSKNERYESRNTVANHDFRPGANPNRRPFLPSSNPQRSTGAASLYTTITWPDPHQEQPETNANRHICDETCTPDYYHAKLANQGDDRIKHHHANVKVKVDYDEDGAPLQYCLKGIKGAGRGGSASRSQAAGKARGLSENPLAHGHQRAFRTTGKPTHDNPYSWIPDPYNDNVNHPNYRGHSSKDGSFRAGRRPEDSFDPSVYKRNIKAERKGAYKDTEQFPQTMGLPKGTHTFISGRERRDGLKDKFIPGGAVHYPPFKHVTPGPYARQEYEQRDTLHGVKDGIFLNHNPPERPKATQRPRFQDSKY